MMRCMRYTRRILLAGILGVAALAVPAAVSMADELPALPDGVANFDPADINFQSFLGRDIETPTNLALSCQVAQASGTTVRGAGDSLSIPVDGVAIWQILMDPDAAVTANCGLQLTIPSGVQKTTVAITNDALEPIVGTNTGSMALECTLSSSPRVNVRVKFGGAVPGNLDVVVTDSTQPFPFMCSFAITFNGEVVSSLVGTIEGVVEIITPLTGTTLCNGATTITCVPIELNNGVVNVTAATGLLDGYVGEGTFSFQNQFTLPTVERQLGVLSDIVNVPITANSLRGAALNPYRKTGKISTMNLALVPGADETAILRPFRAPGTAVATIRNGGQISLVTAPGSS